MTCQTCTDVARRGYCAPFRCYCGHKTCHAFASFVPRITRNVSITPRKKRGPSAWDERSEDGWIDKL